MDYHTIGISLKTLGEVILAITIITVHYKIKKEKKIDKFVIKEITHEEILGVLSISLIIVGFLFELTSVRA